jgi:pimeloyl-ACP methyl ester carboxylesterase
MHIFVNSVTMKQNAVGIALLLSCFVLLLSHGEAFLGAALTSKNPKIDTSFVPPDCAEAGITEELCIDTSQRMQRVKVPIPTTIHEDGQVGISYSYWPSTRRSQLPTVVLIHGFDSSNLEFRRLGSRLASRGVDTYAVDLLGWGYTQLEGVLDFSAAAKVAALQSFLQTVVRGDFCVAGASLGGAAAIETAVCNPSCQGLILMDAQGFVDGVGMMASLPTPIAKLGVNVLQSIPLRSSANQMSYFDKATFATDEAVTVGRLHCLQDGWNAALVNFMKSGGFAPSKLVSQVPVPTLVLWGRQDTILDGNEFAPKFLETLPTASLTWIEECGHVPHLEQPECVIVSSMPVELWLDLIFLFSLCSTVKQPMQSQVFCRLYASNQHSLQRMLPRVN